MYDIIVVGGGPAGLTAALYSVRAGKSVLVLEKANYGGQMALSPRIENYLGFSKISGYDLSEMIFKQVEAVGAELLDEEALSISEKDNIKIVKTDGGEYQSKAVIIATGMRHRVLGVKNENEYSGNGISYCAACDGAFYKEKCVAVVGGGNSAVQEALYLCDICKRVTVMQNLPSLTAENKLCEQLKKRKNARFLFNTVITEFTGDGENLTGVIAENTDTKTLSELTFDGVFVAIGFEADNDIFKGLITLDNENFILSDDEMKTDRGGIFTAGDCRSKKIRQITTAMADGTTAAFSACKYVDELNK